jgi:SAM-dependent methyltransferase
VDTLPDDRPLRVLEVGAGCGATSAQVLPELPGDRASYRFTDVSTFFTERARARRARFPFVTYAVFDINDPPEAQGVPRGTVDLILASNVVHNARDLDRTLRQLGLALAPDGLLVLVENTLNEPFHMVTVGFYQEFGGYADGRQLPLLDPQAWRAKLRAAGYAHAETIPEAGVDTPRAVGPSGGGITSLGQHVIVARPGTAVGVDPDTLRATLAELLPAYMVPAHVRVLDQTPLSANGKVDLSAVPSPWPAEPAPRVDPRGEVERRIFDIWRETLARDDFGVDDNFFELGGDSLHGVRIIARLREELGVTVTADEGLQLLFDGPTVAAMARAVRPAAD